LFFFFFFSILFNNRGVFLRDLLYIDEANKGVKIDENGNEVINMNKYLLMGDIIMMIKNFQLR